MSDAYTVAAALDEAATAYVAELANVVGKYAQLGLAIVRRNASGRPGPRRVTGDYLRSWSVERDGPFAASVGTNAPQGRRLENGFVGTDSLGRHYNQPPYPHVGPMADEIEEPFAVAVAEAWGHVL